MGGYEHQNNKRLSLWDREQYSSSSTRPTGISQCQEDLPPRALLSFSKNHCRHSDGHRCFSPQHKRMRFSQDWIGMAVSPESSASAAAEQQEPTAVLWWKRKHDNHPVQQQSNSNHEALGGTHHRSIKLCHVCQKPYDLQSVTTSCGSPAQKPAKVDVKNCKTILSYFSPRTPNIQQNTPATDRSSAILVIPTTDSTENFCRCTFCERADVCSDCRNVCGTCEQWFCTFCTTTDYSTDPIRIVCLDCHRQQHQKENDQETEHLATVRTPCTGHDDAMQID
jgi:hypothetical protein